MKIATTNKLSQSLKPPTFHLVPVGYGAKHLAALYVEQREWRYRDGNENTNVRVQDCIPWKEICSNNCLPVTIQYLWKEKIDLPRCQNIMDHYCMWEQFKKV